jgi:hypothetical protein
MGESGVRWAGYRRGVYMGYDLRRGGWETVKLVWKGSGLGAGGAEGD